jgi:hypothetical protein
VLATADAAYIASDTAAWIAPPEATEEPVQAAGSETMRVGQIGHFVTEVKRWYDQAVVGSRAFWLAAHVLNIETDVEAVL